MFYKALPVTPNLKKELNRTRAGNDELSAWIQAPEPPMHELRTRIVPYYWVALGILALAAPGRIALAITVRRQFRSSHGRCVACAMTYARCSECGAARAKGAA